MRQNDRVRQVRRYKMLLCVAAGVAAGVLITFIAAKGVLSEHEQTLTTQNEALEKENEDLRTQEMCIRYRCDCSTVTYQT